MDYEVVVIGASAGGLQALQELLALLPTDFSLAMIIVLHRPPASDDWLAFSLNEIGSLRVKEADPDDRIEPGRVYLAPANYHLLVEPDKRLSLSIDAKVGYSRPAIDVLFETAADTYHSHLIGLVLSGASNDGTAGLHRIKAQGGLTIAQDPATAKSKLMPYSAIQENVIDLILTLPEIASFLIRVATKGSA